MKVPGHDHLENLTGLVSDHCRSNALNQTNAGYNTTVNMTAVMLVYIFKAYSFVGGAA